MQRYNYNELLHYYISDNITNYFNYLIVFTITKVRKPIIIKPKKIKSVNEHKKYRYLPDLSIVMKN